MINQFSPRKFEDFTIVENDGKTIIGKLRVKPSGLAWAPKGSHKFFTVKLSTFEEWIKKEGAHTKK